MSAAPPTPQYTDDLAEDSRVGRRDWDEYATTLADQDLYRYGLGGLSGGSRVLILEALKSIRLAESPWHNQSKELTKARLHIDLAGLAR